MARPPEVSEAGAPGGRSRSESLGDRLFRFLCMGSALAIVALAVALVAVLAWKSMPAYEALGLSNLVRRNWDPVHREFGVLPFIYGTLATSLIAMAIAVPLGVGTAAYLSEIASGTVRRYGSFFVEMLAAVPSVVYGFWGLFVLAPNFNRLVVALGGPNAGGVGILPAGLILAIMIVPYVASVTFDVLQAVPRSQREGSLALGATRWQMIRTAVIPYARPGIIGGCFLALGRALGETMAVTMMIGNSATIDPSPLAYGNSIASVIANEIKEAFSNVQRSVLVELGLILLLVSAGLSAAARFLIALVQSGRGLPGRGVRRRKRHRPLLADYAKTPEDDARPGGNPRAQRFDRFMSLVLMACLALTVGLLFLILGYLIAEGVGALSVNFFTRLPNFLDVNKGGMAHAFYGSFLLVGLATLFAVPVGLLAAIYLAEYRRGRLASAVRFIAELLLSVPSIVVGIFVYTVAVQPVHEFSGWAGAFALAIIMLPVVTRASEEALKLVPDTLRFASFALGASHWQTIVRVSVPAALPAIVTAIFLAIARVAGETAPLLLTAFNNDYWPDSPAYPTPSLPAYIYKYSGSPDGDQVRQAWAAALMLLIVVMLLNFGIRKLTGKRLVSASRSE